MTVSYLYSERKVSSHKFKMFFKLSPSLTNATTTTFTANNFVTNMPAQNIKLSYDLTESIVTLEGEYL